MSGAIQNFGKGALRVAKGYTRGYSATQIKVRDATCNQAWGPSGAEMSEIAQLTYNQNDFVEVMEMLDKRLNDKGKNWRHVFKALTVLDYCLHAGSENVVIYFKDNLYIIKTLIGFVHVDDDDKDVGSNVRQKAKDITNLLMDDERLRAERRARGAMQDRMAGNPRRSEDENVDRRDRPRPKPKSTARADEDDDLQRAIRASLTSTDDQAERDRMAKEEAELRKVLALSESEEAERKRKEDERIKALDDQNSKALFDDSFQMNGSNAYQQPVDLFAQQTAFNQQQPQPTGGWPLVDTSFGQQSQFNPFYQQQMMEQQQAQQQAQQQYLQMQYQAQQEALLRDQQQQAYFAEQQRLQQQQQQQQLMPQPTGYGSNNPFAAGFQPQAAPPMPQPSFLTPTPQPNPTPFFSTPAPEPVRQPTPQKPARDDGEHSKLAGLLANRGDGIDTFGNVGNLRVPNYHNPNAQLVGQRTGANNPFQRPGQSGQQQQQQPTSGNLVDF